MMEEKLIPQTLKYWATRFAYAEYESDGKKFKVPLTNIQVDEDNGRLIVDFNINDEITNDANITSVAWFDDNGELLDKSEENIIRESYLVGIMYRYILYLKKES